MSAKGLGLQRAGDEDGWVLRIWGSRSRAVSEELGQVSQFPPGFPRQPLQSLCKWDGELEGKAEPLFSSTGMGWKGFQPCLVREMLPREGRGCGAGGCRSFTQRGCAGVFDHKGGPGGAGGAAGTALCPVGWEGQKQGRLELVEKREDKCPGEGGGQWCGIAWKMLLGSWIMTFPFSPSITLRL